METHASAVVPNIDEQSPSSTTYPNRSDINAKQRPKSKGKKDTHFLCFPLVTESSIPQLHQSLSYFRDISTPISDDDDTTTSPTTSKTNSNTPSNLRIIPRQAHRPPGTFHLTLGVMDLSSPTQYSKAIKLLQDFDLNHLFSEISSSSSSSPEPISISLKSLSSFPSPSKARVLYALPSDPTNRLQEFAVKIRQKWREEGLILEGRALVLHATVANLRYASQAKGHRGGKKNAKGKKSDDGEVDARALIDVFDKRGGRVEGVSWDQGVQEQQEEDEGNEDKFIWAKNIPVNKLAICKLGAVKSEDEIWGLEYPPVAFKEF